MDLTDPIHCDCAPSTSYQTPVSTPLRQIQTSPAYMHVPHRNRSSTGPGLGHLITFPSSPILSQTHHSSIIPSLPSFPSLQTLPQSVSETWHHRLLYKLRDLDLSNVEATPHVEPHIASPLLPSTLEDVHPQAQSPGTSPPGCIPSREPTTSRPNSIYDLFDSYIDVLVSTTPTTRYYKVPSFYLTSPRLRDLSGPPRNPLKGHHLFAPATTRSFLSLVAVPVAPFELQPAPSTLQHKLSYTKPYLKTYSDPGLTHALSSEGKLDPKLRQHRSDMGGKHQKCKSIEARGSGDDSNSENHDEENLPPIPPKKKTKPLNCQSRQGQALATTEPDGGGGSKKSLSFKRKATKGSGKSTRRRGAKGRHGKQGKSKGLSSDDNGYETGADDQASQDE
ncbi:hypothetical protein F5051DRAFT_445980 [Lentinula edodes]|nr:hypothetical protein F5051DRAFT_445980 [Lentinula edodes]